METHSINNLFYVDSFAVIIMILVMFIGSCVANFSKRYLLGSNHYYRFFWILGALLISISIMVCADHLLILLMAWGASNALLVKLMIFNSNWNAAKASGVLAAKNFALAFLLVTFAFLILYLQSGQTSVQAIIQHNSSSSVELTFALISLALGAMMQSAIFPFHKWLISSLNSPTPVSAIMHAGLVNGGGILLTRFFALYADSPILLQMLFIFGLLSALIGTLFKLLQSDVKRMLACSTMAQMGFMIVQCGLGLFPAAVAHLCFHGLFKAYLFLGTGSVAQEKRLCVHYPPRLIAFLCCLGCGKVGSYMFSFSSAKIWFVQDTTLVLTIIAFISTSHFALAILKNRPFVNLPLALIITTLIGGIYGYSVHLVETILGPNSMHPQPLNIIYITGVILLLAVWMLFIFWKNPKSESYRAKIMMYWYVKILNASQPHPSTITPYRNYYKYL